MPRGLRFAAGVCLLISCICGLWAATEVIQLATLDRIADQLLLGEPSKQALKAPGQELPGTFELNQRMLAAQVAALEPVRDTRLALLVALTVVCAFSFVASLRMLSPAGLSRERIRRLLGGTALIAAVLRTIEGAQWSVVTSNMVGPMTEALGTFATLQEAELARALQQLIPSLPQLAFGLNVAQTALMAGTFALLSQYFRSERVREATIALDGPLDAD